MNEYLAIDNGGYLYEQPSGINCSVARCFPEVEMVFTVREVKCFEQFRVQNTAPYKKLPLVVVAIGYTLLILLNV